MTALAWWTRIRAFGMRASSETISGSARKSALFCARRRTCARLLVDRSEEDCPASSNISTANAIAKRKRALPVCRSRSSPACAFSARQGGSYAPIHVGDRARADDEPASSSRVRAAWAIRAGSRNHVGARVGAVDRCRLACTTSGRLIFAPSKHCPIRPV